MDRETIIKLARESYIFPTQEKDDNGTGMWFTFTVYKGSIDALEKFAKLVAEHSASVEREACARVVNDDRGLSDDDAIRVMRAIRARGNT